MNFDYKDLLYKEHHVSEKYPRLSQEQRAAQFMPFAALTGFSDSIEKTAASKINETLEAEKGVLESEYDYISDCYPASASVNQGI